MRKSLWICFGFIVLTLLYVILFLFSKKVKADTLPAFQSRQYEQSNIDTVRVDKLASLGKLTPGGIYHPEINFVVKLQSNGQRVYLLPTAHTVKCLTNKNFLVESIFFNYDNDCALVTKSPLQQTVPNQYGWFYLNPPESYDLTQWTPLPYDGTFSIQLINNDTRWLAFRAIEISNFTQEKTPGSVEYYQNMIYPDVSVNNCNPATDCWWDSESSYISLGWQENNPTVGWTAKTLMHDEGPIVWPVSPGYRVWQYDANLGKYRWTRPETAAMYHPTSFVNNDGYIYLFYTNNWCMRAARAPISGNGMPGTWKNFYNGGFTEDSLPAGFSYAHIMDFLDKPGGNSSCLFPDDQSSGINQQFISVAKLKNTQYYIAAIERYSFSGNWTDIALRLSRDLVNWSPVITVVQKTGGTWGVIDYCYPTFIDSDATTNYEVDPASFYLMGNSCGSRHTYQMHKFRMGIDISPSEAALIPFVDQYYGEFIGNIPAQSSPEFQGKVNDLRSNGCLYVQKEIMQLPSFINGRKATLSDVEYVKMLYRALLSRDPNADPNGVNWWVAQLTSGVVNRDSILDKMWDGWEPTYVCREGVIYPPYQIFPTPTPTPSPSPTSSPSLVPTPSPSFSIPDLKTLITIFLGRLDEMYQPVDSKVNMLDAAYVMKYLTNPVAQHCWGLDGVCNPSCSLGGYTLTGCGAACHNGLPCSTDGTGACYLNQGNQSYVSCYYDSQGVCSGCTDLGFGAQYGSCVEATTACVWYN